MRLPRLENKRIARLDQSQPHVVTRRTFPRDDVTEFPLLTVRLMPRGKLLQRSGTALYCDLGDNPSQVAVVAGQGHSHV
ncbi:MAG: hypothetical protein ACJASX_003865 [Limisphaerales bacterium]|jgi:hypothetical protein